MGFLYRNLECGSEAAAFAIKAAASLPHSKIIFR
jgi:hypothetical protein